MTPDRSVESRVVFHALGGLALRDQAGRDLPVVLAQPKRLALLLYLALGRQMGPRRGAELLRRDVLLALFWPELDQHHARGALRKALQFLRRSLGNGAVVTRGEEEAGLDRAVLWCDAVAFVEALDERRPADALALYQGDLAPGLYVAGAPAVEEWIETERARLKTLAARAARGLREECDAAGRLTLAVDWGRRAVALAPDDERVWRELIGLLDRLGDRAGALRTYEALAERLATEHEVEPSPETQQLVAAMRARVAQVGPPRLEDVRPATAPAVPPVGQLNASDVLGGVLTDRYLIEREVSQASGLARVFVARDLKHDRKVALKVLAAEPAMEEGRERFLREIQIAARLSHPHILTLYDSGEVGGRLYFVMPFIEGETLRDRLERERELPVDVALTITRQAAAALEYAHGMGVVHRDVKPENILLHAGEVLVADFGIAHATRVAVSPGAGSERLTAAGIALGTPGYMSPEQAAGIRSPDARSDVYSLAAVLYEMLVGEPPHTGPDAQAVLVRVLTDPVRPVRATRDSVPPRIDAAVQKGLARRPSDRFPSAAAFALALADGARDMPAASSGLAWRRGFRHRLPSGYRPLLIGGLGLALLVVGALLGRRIWPAAHSASDAEGRAVRRSNIALPDSAPLAFLGAAPLGIGRTALAISPDGSRFVYVSQRGATTQLYLRALDRLEAEPLPGTDGAYQPFFSPDGRWVGFFAGRELKKVSVAGGPAVTLASVREPSGGAWASDDKILVADFQGNKPSWIPSAGGAPQPVASWSGPRLYRPEIVWAGEPAQPWVLCGSITGLLYLSSLSSGDVFVLTRDGIARQDSVDLSRALYGTNPRYLNSGHIAYFSGSGVLMALPFDAVHRRVLGPPEAVLQGVRLEGEEGGPQLAVSDGGTLIYAPGENARQSLAVWVDHASGRIDTLPLPRAGYGTFALSPDGQRLIARIVPASGPAEIWALDVVHGERAHIPVGGIPGHTLKWWPDGSAVLFAEIGASGSTSERAVVRQSLFSDGHRDTLVRGAIHFDPSPNGRFLAVADFPAPGLRVAALDGSAEPLQLAADPAAFVKFSPDGRWLAYTDWAPEESEVKVVRITPPGTPHTVSVDGGEEPTWTPDSRTVIYRNGERWFAVDISATDNFRASAPRLLFQGPFLQVPGVSHDISRDGRRQLVLLGPAELTTNELVVVTNWFTEVSRAAPSRPNE